MLFLSLWFPVGFFPGRSSNSPKVKQQLARLNLPLGPDSWLESPLVIYTNGPLTPTSAAKTPSRGLKS